MWGYVALLIGVIIFGIDLYYAFVLLGLRKRKRGKCKGYLHKTVQNKNVYVGRSLGRFYKRYIDYTYAYRINGKEYYVSGGAPGVKGNLCQTVDVIYHKKNPKIAYIYNLQFCHPRLVFAILLCPIWIFLLVFGFLWI